MRRKKWDSNIMNNLQFVSVLILQLKTTPLNHEFGIINRVNLFTIPNCSRPGRVAALQCAVLFATLKRTN